MLQLFKQRFCACVCICCTHFLVILFVFIVYKTLRRWRIIILIVVVVVVGYCCCCWLVLRQGTVESVRSHGLISLRIIEEVCHAKLDCCLHSSERDRYTWFFVVFNGKEKEER